jgi:15-cis-phytoene synthase
MSSAADADAAFCADLVRGHDFDRYASTLFVDAGTRRALLALYAFNVEICRVRDQVSQPLPGEIRLQWWTDMLAGGGHGGVEGNPVAAELLRAIGTYQLPVEPLSRLIDAHLFDLYNDPMPDMPALQAYADATASTLFVLGARVMGEASDATAHLSRHAGLAQGIAGVIATFRADAARRQLFLPLQLLESRGSSIEEALARAATPQLHAAVGQVASEAQAHFAKAFDLLAEAPRAVRPIFLPLALVRDDLERMSRADYDLFNPPARSRLRTLWILWRASRALP